MLPTVRDGAWCLFRHFVIESRNSGSVCGLVRAVAPGVVPAVAPAVGYRRVGAVVAGEASRLRVRLDRYVSAALELWITRGVGSDAAIVAEFVEAIGVERQGESRRG